MKMIGWFLLLTREMAGVALEESASGASALYHTAKQKKPANHFHFQIRVISLLTSSHKQHLSIFGETPVKISALSLQQRDCIFKIVDCRFYSLHFCQSSI
jgi:hypothetical protein